MKANPRTRRGTNSAPVAVEEAEPVSSGWPSFKPKNVDIKQLKIEWIGNLPVGSGGGVIRNVQETLYIDDVDVVAHSQYANPGGDLQQVEFNLEGQTADGRLSITGAWTPVSDTIFAFRTVLDNVGANAFARWTHPRSGRRRHGHARGAGNARRTGGRCLGTTVTGAYRWRARTGRAAGGRHQGLRAEDQKFFSR